MQSVYEASTGIEAHMIKNLLHLSEVDSEIFGEHLQGGVGDLQAIGMVRVMVADQDYDRARKIVSDWESSQPAPDPISELSDRRWGGFGSALFGFILGAAVVVLLTQTAVDQYGIDYDGDGERDQVWEYVNNLLRSAKADRNRDGEFDEFHEYDFGGKIETSLFDNDFDGRPESECRYREGVLVSCRTDVNGDGFYESRERYSRGVLASIVMYDPTSRQPKKKQYFEGQRLRKAEIDLDGDGELETLLEYDEFEELIRSSQQ